jgi:S1-C subfamily serine protease
MKALSTLFAISCLAVFGAVRQAAAQQPFTAVAEEVNQKVVKLFGAGGFKGLPSYGSGILISPKGHILTCNNHILSTTDLRVHLHDGRLYHAKVLFREPELDVAVCKIDEEIGALPFFDFAQAAQRPLAEIGDWLLAFSNCFQIATRNEPMTVQRSVVAAFAELRGRRGVFDAPFTGEVYFLDGIACNPGAAGGPITNRKGELLGVLGRELKSTQTDTWINYAIPIQAKADIQREEGKTVKVDMATFVKESIEGKYRQSDPNKAKKDKGGYHGIILVANAVSATPPYVEEVIPGSPAAQAGLRPDDLIVYVDGELIPSIRLFRDMMKQAGPGQEVLLEIQRGSRLISARLKLREQPKEKSK